MRSTPALTYRSRLLATIGWAMIVLAVLVVVAVVLARPAPTWFWVPATIAAGLGAVALLHRCYVAPRVVATERGIRVVNPFSTSNLPWSDIERFESLPMLTIVRRDGTTVTAWAVQQVTAARLVGRIGQAEPVAAALARQLAAATLPPESP